MMIYKESGVVQWLDNYNNSKKKKVLYDKFKYNHDAVDFAPIDHDVDD